MKINYNGEYLRNLRIQKGVKQKEVADILGISRQMLSYYENGIKTPSIQKAKELANYYNVSFLSILYGDEAIENDKEDKLNSNCEFNNIILKNKIVLGTRNNQKILISKNIIKNILNINFETNCCYDNFSKNQIIDSIRNNENIVVYTSNKALYNNSYYELKENNYNVKIFNLSNPLKSDSWNLLDDLYTLSNNSETIKEFLNIFDKNKESNNLIKKAKLHLFNSLCDYVYWNYDIIKTVAYEYKRDFAIIRYILKENDIKKLNSIMEKEPIYKYSKEQWDLFYKYTDEIKEIAYLELLSDFEIFDNLEIKNITRTNDFSCKDIIKEKVAIFIISPLVNSYYNELANALVNVLINWTIFYKTSIKENNKTQINFIFDKILKDSNILNLNTIEKLNSCDSKIYLNLNTLISLKKFLDEFEFVEFLDKFNLKFINNNINKRDIEILDISKISLNNEKILIKLNKDEFILNRYNENFKDNKYDIDSYIPEWKKRLNEINFRFGSEFMKEI